MNKVIWFCLNLTALYSLSISPMKAAQLADILPSSSESILYTEVQPFSPTPFDHVPNIVYANSLYKLHWPSDADVRTLKQGAATFAISPLNIETMVKKLQEEQWKGMSEDYSTECTRLRETYDWIHAMRLIEESLGCNQLSTGQVKQVNARLTRLTNQTEGQFRADPIFWSFKELSDEEHFFLDYIERNTKKNYITIFRSMPHSRKFCESSEGIRNNKDQYLRVKDKNFIDVNSIKELLRAATNLKIRDQSTKKPIIFDSEEVDMWERQAQEYPNYQKGFIDWNNWLKQRIHFFYESSVIASSLEEALDTINKNNMHPIQAAAYIWLRIVRIHPWDAGHKRTGKALASWILLRNGYLPPLITEADLTEFRRTLAASLDEEKGDELFTKLLARLITETQEKFQGRAI